MEALTPPSARGISESPIESAAPRTFVETLSSSVPVTPSDFHVADAVEYHRLTPAQAAQMMLLSALDELLEELGNIAAVDDATLQVETVSKRLEGSTHAQPSAKPASPAANTLNSTRDSDVEAGVRSPSHRIETPSSPPAEKKLSTPPFSPSVAAQAEPPTIRLARIIDPLPVGFAQHVVQSISHDVSDVEQRRVLESGVESSPNAVFAEIAREIDRLIATSPDSSERSLPIAVRNRIDQILQLLELVLHAEPADFPFEDDTVLMKLMAQFPKDLFDVLTKSESPRVSHDDESADLNSLPNRGRATGRGSPHDPRLSAGVGERPFIEMLEQRDSKPGAARIAFEDSIRELHATVTLATGKTTTSPSAAPWLLAFHPALPGLLRSAGVPTSYRRTKRIADHPRRSDSESKRNDNGSSQGLWWLEAFLKARMADADDAASRRSR